MPMVETQCDGMPSMRGCGETILLRRAFTKPGKKGSGWYVTWSLDDHNKPIEPLLHFCPSCAVTVQRQEASQ